MPAAKPATKTPFGRKDPKPRHLDGSAIWARLRNPSPDKHYVYVNKGDPEAMAHYESAGYDPVLMTADGVQPAGGRTVPVGQPIEVRGMILHSVDMTRFQQIELEGVDGNAGQLEADRVEESIVDRSGISDPLRGMHSRFGLTVQNETQRTTEVEL